MKILLKTSDIIRAIFLKGMALLLIGSSLANAGTVINHPNVVLVMTDDQGYGDIGYHGNPWVKTPEMDKLASQSIRLDDYHVSPYCVPSRAALLTGRYADRTGIHNVLEPHWFVRTNEMLISEMFQNAGYLTGMFGKWHLGDNYPYGPEFRGFDDVLRFNGGAIGVLADYWDNCYEDDAYFRNGKPSQAKGYCTDVFFSAAKEFIDSALEREKPFFVYLATNAPHGPKICPPSYAAPYAKGKTKTLATFYGMIANIDENLGSLREYLKDKGIDKNTIFIFCTDNGSAGGHRLYNSGMKGNKGSAYEGGHRVPFFLHWPEGGFDEEKQINRLTAHIDIVPTLLDLCDIEQSEGVQLDGISLRPLLEKGDHDDWPDRVIMTDAHQRKPPEKWVSTAVMSERWRLVEGKELYDIIADPGQETNLYSEYPEVVTRLSAHYDKLWEELEPTLSDIAKIPLGHPMAESVDLNYHDCIGRHMFWFQNGIRSLTGDIPGEATDLIDAAGSKRPMAFWPIEVITEGEYTIELRRWPKEAATAIQADLPPGGKVYGLDSHRSTPGIGFPAVKAQLSIGGKSYEKVVDGNAAGVVFKVNLKQGSNTISAKFIDGQGRTLDAFFVYVNKSRAL